MLSIRLACFAVAALVLNVSWVGVAQAQPSGYDGYQVVRIAVGNEEDLAKLQELQGLGRDFQVWSEQVGIGLMDVRVAPTAQPALNASGLHYEVTIKDLQQYLDELFPQMRDPFFNSLRTYNEHVQFMSTLAAAYPTITEMLSLGQSVQGREMWALRITNGEGLKPAVFFHGAEHGDEAAGASVTAYVANHLLTNYGVDPDVTALVNNVEWYLLPIMNPDGYVAYDRWNANGVDLNRNWDGPGSGQDPWGGPYPFSEPETAALRDFLQHSPTVLVHTDIHGYVPYIMWPWAHTGTHCPDHATFLSIATEMRDRVAAAGGGTYTIGTIYDVMWYSISGCSTNYSYGVLDLWAFAIEVVDDDMPNICEEFLSALLYLGEWMWDNDCNANGEFDSDDLAGGTSLDCNGNGAPDECDISSGSSSDDNGNGIPDECEDCPQPGGSGNYCITDVYPNNGDGTWDPNDDGDCVIDISDLGEVLPNYGTTSGMTREDGDVYPVPDGDGAVDISDLGELLAQYGDDCS